MGKLPKRWSVQVTVQPYDHMAWTKNRIHASTRRGGKRVTRAAREASDGLTELLMVAMDDKGVVPAQGRWWLRITVYRRDYKSDPHNVLDLVADAAQRAIGIDDRYMELRGIPWELDRENPRFIVEMGQETVT